MGEEFGRMREKGLPRATLGCRGGCFSLPAGFERGECEGGELGCDGEDAVEFPVGAGSGYGG